MPDGDDVQPKPGAPKDPQDEDLARRLDALGQDLGRKQPGPKGSSSATGYAQAFRMSTDFVAGVLVGFALGWGFDALFGTSPWGMIGFLLLGFAAGVMNVLRTAGLVSDPAMRGMDASADDGKAVSTGKPDRPVDE